MNYFNINIEGGLLSPDFLEAIHEAPGQKPQDFGLKPRDSLVDEVSTIWGDARTYWEAFRRRAARAQSGRRAESLTTITREQWALPLLEALGYTLTYQRRAVEADGRTYAISHRAGPDENAPPVHIVAINQDLGDRPPSGRGALSPHALLQDYLNRTDEHLWGVVTNGKILRLLRDSTYFTRPAYIEFDLEGMLEGERLDEFFLLYRLAHRTRLPRPGEPPADCLLEQYYQQTLEQGGRIRDGLRQAVADAIIVLGNGFLRHPRNEALRARIYNGELDADAFYQQLLYLIYRLLFLMVAEERNLLETAGEQRSGEAGENAVSPAPPLPHSPASFYRQYASVSRLRRLADTPLSAPERFDDLYLGLRALFYAFHDERLAALLGVPPLNGELFSSDRAPDLDAAHLNNRDLLRAIRLLSYFTPPEEKVRRRVNYAALDVEELGSVYESLLDEQPVIDMVTRWQGDTVTGDVTPSPPHRVTFSFVRGTARKTTGSYYTPRELVNEVIKSALVPVIEARLTPASPHPLTPSQKEAALLSLRVCDPACGSGHFLLAAARRIGYELARARGGADEPSPRLIRAATRDAITHCIYGVDKNPLAVDLCKVALWIEGYSRGKPLTFLDYRIRCGDSLVGVFDLDVLAEGIPDAAYKPVSGDDKQTAASLRRQNKRERAGQAGLLADLGETTAPPDAAAWAALSAMPEDTPAQINAKRAAYTRLQREADSLRAAANLWTAAFFAPLTPENRSRVPTSDSLRRWRQGLSVNRETAAAADALAEENRFFHWPLEFPQVFERGGFDAVLGNPPWEHTELKEKEWFASRDPEIAQAPGAKRKRMIQALTANNPALHAEFVKAKHTHDSISHFVRYSGRYPLCGRGRINTYAVFAELARDLQRDAGRVGIIVPSGIATDDTTKFYFRDIMEKQALVSLYDFENRQKIFPAVDSRMKFCLLTLTGAARPAASAEFVFFAQEAADLRDEERRFTLSAADIALLNPNTRTCPIFRSRRDAELTKAIYRRVPVLIKEGEPEQNPWGITFRQGLFNMTSDSGLFRAREKLEEAGYRLAGNRFARSVRSNDFSRATAEAVTTNEEEVYLPLYEAKMLHQFDHRWATYDGPKTRDATPAEKNNPAFFVLPRYWVAEKEVAERLARHPGWLLGFRDIARSTDERTAIFSILPETAVGHKAPLIFLGSAFRTLTHCFVTGMLSFVFDYVTRQSVGGTSLSYFILKQLPVLPPDTYRQPCLWQSIATSQSLVSNLQSSISAFLLPRVLELTYTAYDLRPFARDCGYHGPPFRWDEERRFFLRCELDAAYFHLYGIERDEAAYIMDTFPIVRRKDEAAYGEYRTKRVILEIYDEMAAAMQGSGGAGEPGGYQTRLNPPPAHPAAAHPWDEAHLGPALPRDQWWQPEAAQGGRGAGGQGDKVTRGQGDKVTAGYPAAPSPSSPAIKEPAPTLELKPPPAPKPKAKPKPTPDIQPALAADFTPPQGGYAQRLKRVMALGQPKNQAELTELIAALGDENDNIRWLAGSALARTGGLGTVRLLGAYLQTQPGETARAAALKALSLISETSEDEAARAAAQEIMQMER